jgi:ParB/RepB/Spo0J family partition protein
MELIPLDAIYDNPYQGQRDYAEIDVLARTIAAQGLKQNPTARPVDGAYQLEFGHRRLRAFRWLKEHYQAEGLSDRYSGYTVMPMEIQDLSDEQMFEGVVVENEHRKSIGPIENARMMKAYRDDFKKSSTEIGLLFGVNDATVRGVIRLLDLPEDIQAKVNTGEISQGAARKLLTIARVDAKQIDQAVINITTGMSADQAVDQAMRDSDKAFTMWFSWNSGKPLAGSRLWSLDLQPEKFPMKHLPTLTAADTAKALDIEFTAQNKPQLTRWIAVLTTGQALGFDGIREAFDGTPSDYLIGQGAPADQIERLGHLVQPPACTACPFHSVSDKQHFCGFKSCHSRKRRAWFEAEAIKVSKRMSIPMYNPAADGKAVLVLAERSFESNHEYHDKLVKENNPELRLQVNFQEYQEHAWTKSYFVRVIAVGAIAVKAKDKVTKSKSNEQAEREKEERQREIDRAMMGASRSFKKEYAADVFAQVFSKLDNMHAMATLANVEIKKSKGTNKEQILNELRAELANDMLDHLLGWQDLEKGPEFVAKHLAGVATTWGMTLPADFAEVAAKYAPVVAVETPTKIGGKK